MSLVGITIPLMPRDAYADAIKAFARLAIASGVEPKLVRDRLGPQALCDTTAARRRPYAELISDVEAAITSIGLPLPAAIRCQPTKANTRDIYSDEAVRAQFAKHAIDCGAAIRKMQESWPEERKRLNVVKNSYTAVEFKRIGKDRLPSHIEEIHITINRSVAVLRRSGDGMGDIDLLRKCRDIIGKLDEHDDAIREAFQNGTEYGSSVRGIYLTQSSRVRRWVAGIAPGPL